jgi:hypothetical protein
MKPSAPGIAPTPAKIQTPLPSDDPSPKIENSADWYIWTRQLAEWVLRQHAKGEMNALRLSVVFDVVEYETKRNNTNEASLVSRVTELEKALEQHEKEIHRLRAGSNYVADDEMYPRRVSFSNGRIVSIAEEGGKTFLKVTPPDPFVPEGVDPNECSYCKHCETPIRDREIYNGKRVWLDDRGGMFCKAAKDRKTILAHSPKLERAMEGK